MTSRMLDRTTYSKRTIDTYETLGAYIVDIYYNHLYTEAIKFKNAGNVASITEGFRHAIFAFISAIDSSSPSTYKAKHYERLLTGINEYFATYMSFSTLSIMDCIDKIMMEFIPVDYYKAIDKDQKRNLLRGILIRSIKDFSQAILKEYLCLIIDNHEETANIKILQECMFDILCMQREQLYMQFMDTSKNEKIDKSVAVQMRKEIKKLNKEKTNLTEQLNMINNQNKTTMENAKSVISKIKLLWEKHQLLKNKYSLLEVDYNKLKAQMISTVGTANYIRSGNSNIEHNPPNHFINRDPTHPINHVPTHSINHVPINHNSTHIINPNPTHTTIIPKMINNPYLNMNLNTNTQFNSSNGYMDHKQETDADDVDNMDNVDNVNNTDNTDDILDNIKNEIVNSSLSKKNKKIGRPRKLNKFIPKKQNNINNADNVGNVDKLNGKLQKKKDLDMTSNNELDEQPQDGSRGGIQDNKSRDELQNDKLQDELQNDKLQDELQNKKADTSFNNEVSEKQSNGFDKIKILLDSKKIVIGKNKNKEVDLTFNTSTGDTNMNDTGDTDGVDGVDGSSADENIDDIY